MTRTIAASAAVACFAATPASARLTAQAMAWPPAQQGVRRWLDGAASGDAARAIRTTRCGSSTDPLAADRCPGSQASRTTSSRRARTGDRRSCGTMTAWDRAEDLGWHVPSQTPRPR